MVAEQAEVVSQDVAVELVTKLSAKGAATEAPGQSAENGARNRTDGDANGAGESTNGRPSLTASQRSTDSTRSTANGADCSGDLHGVMKRSDFGGVTAGALQ